MNGLGLGLGKLHGGMICLPHGVVFKKVHLPLQFATY